MNNRLSFVAFFALFALSLCAQQITESKARSIASTFYGSGTKLNLVQVGGEASAPDYYIFNVGDNQGHIIIAGDERMSDPIFGYSDYGSFDSQNVSSEFKSLLDAYSRTVKASRKAITTKKKAIKQSRITPRSEITQVGPYARHITWNQLHPYNIEVVKNNLGGPYTGCGATALSILMKYHSWPLKGMGSTPSYWQNGGFDFSNHTYNWDLMTPSYDDQSTDAEMNEVAKLMYHTGLSVRMSYNPAASGSSVRDFPNALSSFFSYDKSMKTAYRTTYTDTEWINLIKKEIDLKRPVIYSGDDKGSAGHVFVCDGYDSTGKISLNYGWGGYGSGFYALENTTYVKDNLILIGIYPNNQTVAVEDQAAPQVALMSSISFSNHSPRLNEAFDIGVKLANHDVITFNGTVGVALFKGNTMQGSVLKEQQVTLDKVGNNGYVESNFDFKAITIPSTTPAGTYKLKPVVQHGSQWLPMICFVNDVTKEVDLKVANGVAAFSYPYDDRGYVLELTKPIDVTVASNFARVRFSIINRDEFYDCENTDVLVMAHSNLSPIPTVWAKVTIEKLAQGMVQDFEINDLPVPPGTDVNSCRYYVAYSRVGTKLGKGREASADPMMPFSYNFSSYKIPKETVIKHLIFKPNTGETRVPIPADYKKYNAEGADNDPNVWKFDIMAGNACGNQMGAKLVTSAFDINDENYVFEWKMNSMYGNNYLYKLYVSTEGQEFSNFVTPVYSKSLDVRAASTETARISLADYVGKKVYIAFEATENGSTGLSYFKMLNIKTPKDIVINKLNIPGTNVTTEPLRIGASVKNNSALNVKEVIASYTIDGKKVEETIKTDIPFSESRDIEFTQLANLTGEAGRKVQITVHMEVAGEDPTLLHNNEVIGNTILSNFEPRKKVLVYKSTKLNCGGCMTSYSVLDNFDEYYPEYCSGVEIWRDGSFKAPADFSNYFVGTTPSIFLNERWYSEFDGYNNTPSFVQQMAPPANVSAETSFGKDESRELNIKLEADFAMPMIGKYKIGAIIIENNVKNIDGQIAGTHPNGDLLVKNHLPIGAIAVKESPEGSVIENPEAQKYTFNCTYTVPAELPYKYRKDNIIVLAVLYGPNGEILNCAPDSYYLKIRETEGLTYVPVDDHSSFKRIYDIETISTVKYNSIVNYRATVAAGGTYQFRIRKDASWNGYKPKLIVNRAAKKNTFIQEILTPDEFGVYTISNVHQNYTIEIEREETVDTYGFKLSYNGQEINDGDEIEVRKHHVIEGQEFFMKFEPEVTNISGTAITMRMEKEEIQAHTGTKTTNTLCWDACMEPTDMYATCANAYPFETQYPYGEIQMIPPRLGTQIIKYKFAASSKSIPTKTVTVKYINDVHSGIDDINQNGGLTIVAKNGIVEITSSIKSDLNVYDISGRLIRTLQINEGVNIVDDLAKGAYLINRTKIIL